MNSLLIILFTIGYFQMVMGEDCGSNEMKSDCAPLQSCQPSCDNRDGTACPRMCETNSCVCKKGFVRDNTNNNSQCVDPSQCPTNTRRKRLSECGPHEVVSSCARLQQCQPSCENPEGTTICPTICSKNPCECEPGFVRLSKDNMTCVARTHCNSTVCGENEIYDSCPNLCQPLCGGISRLACQTLGCFGGCVCKPGYYRNTDDQSNQCVPCPQIID